MIPRKGRAGYGIAPDGHPMFNKLASSIMPRTTVTIDASVLRALKRRARDEGKSLGQVISEILAPALAAGERTGQTSSFRWRSKPMEAKVDLEDKEAMQEALGDR